MYSDFRAVDLTQHEQTYYYVDINIIFFSLVFSTSIPECSKPLNII